MALYDTPIATLNGEPFALEALRGRAVLVVNVASKCGLTPQYAGLEALQERYADKGFTVLGVPCNQFGGQEPGTRRGDRDVLLHHLRRHVPAHREDRRQRRRAAPALRRAHHRPTPRARPATCSGTSRSSSRNRRHRPAPVPLPHGADLAGGHQGDRGRPALAASTLGRYPTASGKMHKKVGPRLPAGAHKYVECRRRPTLPHPNECSTIGAGGLSFRVRDGTGRFPSAITTDNTINLSTNHSGRTQWIARNTPQPHTTCGCVFRVAQWMQTTRYEQALGLLVPVNSTPHRASISGLSTQWSAGGLNHARWWETSSWNELPA